MDTTYKLLWGYLDWQFYNINYPRNEYKNK